MASKGTETRLMEKAAIIKDGEVLLEGIQEDGLYRIHLTKGMVNFLKADEARQLWHRRLAHMGMQDVVEMSKLGVAEGMHVLTNIKEGEELPCEACGVGKAARTPFPHSHSRTTKKLEIVWADLHGPLRTATKGMRAKYVLTLKDDYTRRHWVFTLRQKSDAAECIKAWLPRAEKEATSTLQKFRTDRGG